MTAPLSCRSTATILFGTYVCLEVVFVAANVSGPAWRREFGLSYVELGLCLGAAPAGMLAAGLFAGYFTERKGTLPVLSFSLAGVICALSVLAAATGFSMVFLGLAIAGLSAVAFHNAGMTVLSSIFPGQLRRVMALASALWFGSSVISAPLVGRWLDFASESGHPAWGVRLPFAALIPLFFAWLAIGRRRLRRLPGGAGTGGGKSESQPAGRLRRDWLWVPALAFCHGMMQASLMAWLNPLAQYVFGTSDFRGSLLFATGALGLASGRLTLAVTRAHGRWNDKALLAASSLTGAALLVLALTAPSYRLALAFTGLGTFASSATAPCLFSLIPAQFPRAQPRLFGYMESSFAAAAIAGAFLVGFFSERGIPLRAAMGLSPLAGFTMSVLALCWLFGERRAAGRPIFSKT